MLAISKTGRGPLGNSYLEQLPEEVISHIFSYTQSYIAESRVSTTIYQKMHDQCFRYFFSKYHSIVNGSEYTFEHLIDARPEDSYFAKTNKAVKYLNDLRYLCRWHI